MEWHQSPKPGTASSSLAGGDKSFLGKDILFSQDKMTNDSRSYFRFFYRQMDNNVLLRPVLELSFIVYREKIMCDVQC